MKKFLFLSLLASISVFALSGCFGSKKESGDKIMLYQAPTSKEIYLLKFDNLDVNTTKAGQIEGFLDISTTSKKVK